MIGYITCSVKKFAAHDTLFIVGDERMRSACAAEFLHYIEFFNQLSFIVKNSLIRACGLVV
jgi:hypothetical protein